MIDTYFGGELVDAHRDRAVARRARGRRRRHAALLQARRAAGRCRSRRPRLDRSAGHLPRLQPAPAAHRARRLRPLLLQARDDDRRAVRERGPRVARHAPSTSSSWPCRRTTRAATSRACSPARCSSTASRSAAGRSTSASRASPCSIAAAARCSTASSGPRNAALPRQLRAGAGRTAPGRPRPRRRRATTSWRSPPPRCRAGRSRSTGRARRCSPPPGAASCSSSPLIAAAAAVAFCLIGWLLLRARREADRQSARARQRGELSHALGAASLAAEVSTGLAAALSRRRSPMRSSVVALEAEDRLGLELAAVQGRLALASASCPISSTAHATTRRATSRARPSRCRRRHRLREQLPDVHAALRRRGALALLRPAARRAARARSGRSACSSRDERALDETEQAHVAWCAEEAAQALDRARSYEHEHAVAVSLQRSLLAAGPARDRRASSCSAATRPAAPASRSAATGTTSCAAATASCTSPSATSPAAASPPPC